jgi:hypothetical protein
MINRKDHYLGWAALLYELEDAHEHLGNLIKDMVSDPEYSDVEFSIQLGHVYAHLNRAWYRRNVPEDFSKETYDAQRDKATKFPGDIEPVG